MSGSEVILKDVTCKFRLASGGEVKALQAVNLQIPEGQFVCVVGRSGGGKSTLVRSIAGLTPLTHGIITSAGKTIQGAGADRGMVFQEDTVFPWMRVSENVEFGLKAQGADRNTRMKTVKEWLDAVGLAGYEKAWPKELSGGMRKRVALATVFAAGAPVLIMDEPFGALDYVTRIALHNVLLNLWRQTKCTIIFVTHDIEEALVLGDRILVVSDGRLADDMVLDLPRPRREEERASAAAVAVTKRIVALLGISAEAEA